MALIENISSYLSSIYDSAKPSIDSGIDSVIDFLNRTGQNISENVVKTYNNIIRVIGNISGAPTEEEQKILDSIKSPKITQSSSTDLTVDRTLLYSNYLGVIQFPIGSILDDYREFLDELTVDSNVDSKFYYSPSAFSNHLYGTPELDYLVLYIAKCQTLFEFNKPKIKILPKENLKIINDIMILKKEEVQKSRTRPQTYLL